MTVPLTSDPKLPPMSAEEFLAWTSEQPVGRFELVDGEVVQMSPERIEHAEVKSETLAALRAALRAERLDCQSLGDGMAVRVGDGSVFEPDVSVRCGPRLPRGTAFMSDPMIVVEVISPSTRQVDTGAKLDGYFSLPSVHHYLIIHPITRAVIHHRRGPGEGIETRILHAGDASEPTLILDPPGLTVAVADLFEAP